MKRPLVIPVLTFLFLTFPVSSFAQPSWSVYFSPHGGITQAIVKEVDHAKSSVLMQAYSFTSAPIAKALLDAHKRGVKVQVLLDKSQSTQRYSSATFLLNQRIPVKIDAAHAIAHNKVMVIDNETVITGSFNFTKQAEERNAENLLIIRDRGLAELYTKKWKEHEKHSEEYERRGSRSERSQVPKPKSSSSAPSS